MMFKYSTMHALSRLGKDDLVNLEEGQRISLQGGFPTNKFKPVKEMIYYERFHDRSVVTVLILVNSSTGEGEEPVIARGVSVCAPVDTFSRAVGRVIARGRAIRAAKKGIPSSLIIRAMSRSDDEDEIPHCEGLQWVHDEFEGYKSVVFPDLTDKEKEIFKMSRSKEEVCDCGCEHDEEGCA